MGNNVRNFKLPPGTGNVPIIGAGPPKQVRDALGRILEVGDFIILNVADRKPFRVVSMKPSTDPRIPHGHMEIVVACTTVYHAQFDMPQVEFLRVLTTEEMKAQREAAGLQPADEAKSDSDGDETPTLKDA